MPTIFPVEPLASWPHDEGVIGIVGVAPWATIDFLQALYSQVNAQKDWHYPRVIADINTKIPSRGRFFELGERDPTPFIKATIVELADMGATVIVVPCNTAHILYDNWSSGISVPVPNIIRSTVNEVLYKNVSKVAVFSSETIRKSKLYSICIEYHGLSYVCLSRAQQDIISAVINNIKINGKPDSYFINQVDNVLQELLNQGVNGLILGCTELKYFETRCKLLFTAVAESNSALAKAALMYCYSK